MEVNFIYAMAILDSDWLKSVDLLLVTGHQWHTGLFVVVSDCACITLVR